MDLIWYKSKIYVIFAQICESKLKNNCDSNHKIKIGTKSNLTWPNLILLIYTIIKNRFHLKQTRDVNLYRTDGYSIRTDPIEFHRTRIFRVRVQVRVWFLNPNYFWVRFGFMAYVSNPTWKTRNPFYYDTNPTPTRNPKLFLIYK